MPEVSPFDTFFSLTVAGKFGRSVGLGEILLGDNYLGDDDELTGVYQKRIRRLAFWTKEHKPKGDTYVCRLRPYPSPNPQTEPQQAWRSVFAAGVAAWQALTNEEKRVYNKRAIGRGMEGFNLFLSEWLKSNR